MSTTDIKHLAVETIYLVPDSSEGQRCYLWCDDPAPGVGMGPSEAVEYVRKDVHEAIIAKQAKAAISGMDASKAVGSSNLEQAKRLHAESNLDELESERAANTLLTERIAELEEREQARATHVEYLEVGVEKNVLSIKIGIETLCHAVSVGRPYGQGDINIVDQEAFIKGLLLELQRESEDGTTPVHSMFDTAVNEMLENGEEGIEIEDEYQ